MITAMLLMAAAPTAQAEALGLRLARAGTLATLLPLMATKETQELAEAHKELSALDQAVLRAVATEQAEAGTRRLLENEGRAYAAALSFHDLRVLVMHAEAAPARRMRAAMPGVIAATMATARAVDFKKDVLAAFCARTGRACAK